MEQILIHSDDKKPRKKASTMWDMEIDRRKKEMQDYKGER